MNYNQLMDCVSYFLLRPLLPIIVTCLAVQSAFAQTKKAVVCDAGSREAIPYASVYIFGRQAGEYTDSAGRFSIPAEGGAIRLAAIGYENRVFEPPFPADTFFLRSAATELQDVIVQGSRQLRTANARCDRGGHNELYSVVGTSYATRISLADNGYHRITAVRLQATRGSDNLPLRIQLYLPDSNGAPGIALLPRGVLVQPRRFQRLKKRIPLEDQEAVVVGGVVFVAVEWMGVEKPREGWSVRFCFNKEKGESYRRFELREDNAWKQVEPIILPNDEGGIETIRASVDYY